MKSQRALRRLGETNLDTKIRQLADRLFAINAVSFGEFRLKLHERNPDAPLSPIYVDLRRVRSFPDVMNLAIAVYEQTMDGIEFGAIADVPTAATPFAAILAFRMQLPLVSPRRDEKTHGLAGKLDGSTTPGTVALLIDDLITRAESKLEAIRVLEENGLAVKDVVVLLDRRQGGAEALAARGYKLHSAIDLLELMAYYKQSGKVSAELFSRVVAYLRSPAPA
jgi:uridine monophosphate synthetase